MNKKGQEINVLGYALVFLVMFFIGGIIGAFSLPEFSGRFFVSGLVFGVFATGAGTVVLKLVFNR